MNMTKRERDKLRQLQDRFLALSSVQRFAEVYGEDARIAGPASPTIADLRRYIYPDERHTIEAAVGGEDVAE